MEDQRSRTLQVRALMYPGVSVAETRKSHEGYCRPSHLLADRTLSTLLQTPKATIACAPFLLGCLATQLLKHLKHNRKLDLGVKIVFLRRNYLRQKIATANLSYEYSRGDPLCLALFTV